MGTGTAVIQIQPLQRLALLYDEEIDAAMETVNFHHKQFDALSFTLHMEKKFRVQLPHTWRVFTEPNGLS